MDNMGNQNYQMSQNLSQMDRNSSRYTNKDSGKGFAWFGYIVLALGVIAAILLVVFLG